VILFARELDIVDYGDNFTRQALQHQMRQSFIILPASMYINWGMIIAQVEKQSLSLMKMKTVIVTDILVDQMCVELKDESIFDTLPSNTICLAILLQGEDSVAKIENVQDYVLKICNSSLIASLQDITITALDDLIFNSHRISTATFDSCTCCIIKPHAVKDRTCGNIIDMIIKAGFEISAVETLFFDRSKAEEFLEVYNGVIPEYSDQTVQLSSGISVALELRGQDAVGMLRKLVGPWDINVAKELYPGSVRGRYGLDKVKSAVHCTDLIEDAQLECQYCFRIMA
jgi:nucleoside-diphosphate kinase